MIVAPSGIRATAASALSRTLFIGLNYKVTMKDTMDTTENSVQVLTIVSRVSFVVEEMGSPSWPDSGFLVQALPPPVGRGEDVGQAIPVVHVGS
jgi:hypothetical protein